MVYLNVILTIICLILLFFLILGYFAWKKYGSSISKITKDNPFSSGLPSFGDPKQMEQSMKLLSSLFKNNSKK